ncbi:MAG: hypothetical protein KC423_05475 [Anaerolineales bacterium]|nr:hypothetical protein [Anaerolineales bacterium]
MPELNRLPATRIVSTALDGAVWPEDRLVLRTAVDELLIIPPVADVSSVTSRDPYAIVVEDASYAGVWLGADEAAAILQRHCEWRVGEQRPLFTQGAIAGIATKLWLEADRVLFVVPAPYAAEFEERIV